jgi:hypothetical protein
MNSRLVCLLLTIKLSICSAFGQQPQQKSTNAVPSPNPEMQKLFNAFLGSWQVTKKVEPSEEMPNGGAGEGEEIYRAGPGNASFIEQIRLKESNGEISGLGVGWWDQKGQGYKAVWCDSENPGVCILMAHLAKWEGEEFVLRDEFENGKKFSFKEVFSEITPTSFMQTLYHGEMGKELKRLLTIHATRSTNQ